jgi:outer membrane protein OmpA-like peptidoglycan-associated protein/uncharacterized protein YidB (DUF937 family)
MAPTDSVTGGAAGREAARFDSLIADTADRFGLGANAGALVREVLNMIAGAPGGVAGFVKTFEAAGLGPELSAWLGRRDAPAMSSQLLDRMVGPAAIDAIAGRLGIGASSASSAVAYVMPKLIGALTPGGTIPAAHPPEPTVARRAGETRPGEIYGERARAPAERGRVAEPVRPRVETVADEPQLGRWLWPLLGALALLGLGSYLLSLGRPSPTPTVTAPVPAPRATVAPTLLPRLLLSHENGVIHFSGAVADQESRDTIVNALKTVYGADRIRGDIEVDSNRSSAPWLVNLRTALEALKVPGVQAAFDGNSVNLGGLIDDADRDRIAGSLRNTLGSGLVYGTLADRVAIIASRANDSVISTLSSLPPGFSGHDLVAALNKSIVNFPTGGSQVPTEAMAMLRSAAGQIKQLPLSAVLEIAGYTDNRGDPAANVKLSQERAEAVRNALIGAGADPMKLVARGYGSANPVASNDTLEGRFRNRRIEYHVLRQ